MGRVRALVACLVVGAAVAPTASAGVALPIDRGRVAFTSDRCDQGGHVWFDHVNGFARCRDSIFTVGRDGTGLTRLTTGASAEDEAQRDSLSGDSEPTFSPDGRKLAFIRQTAEGAGAFRLFLMRADGSQQRALLPADGSDFRNPAWPTWSPRGGLIALVDSSAPDESAILAIDPETRSVRRLSPGHLVPGPPEFTNDGRWVVYVGSQLDAKWRPIDVALYRTSIDGQTTERLSMGTLALPELNFSPDGRYAAFNDQGTGHVFTMRADGSDVVRRSSGPGSRTTWSPVGPTVFYSATSGPPGEHHRSVYAAAAPGAGEGAPLTDATSRDGEPDYGGPADPDVEIPPVDDLAPGVLLGPQLSSSARRASTTRAAKRRRRALPFAVFDPSGIRRVSVAIARRARRHRCRFAGRSGRLGPRRPCAATKHAYHRVRGIGTWRRLTRRLTRGTYVLRFRTTDRRGNRARHPRRRVVRLR